MTDIDLILRNQVSIMRALIALLPVDHSVRRDLAENVVQAEHKRLRDSDQMADAAIGPQAREAELQWRDKFTAQNVKVLLGVARGQGS